MCRRNSRQAPGVDPPFCGHPAFILVRRMIMYRRLWIGWIVSIAALLLVFGSAPIGSLAAPAISPLGAALESKLSYRLELLANSAELRTASAGEQALALSLMPSGPGSLVRD